MRRVAKPAVRQKELARLRRSLISSVTGCPAIQGQVSTAILLLTVRAVDYTHHRNVVAVPLQAGRSGLFIENEVIADSLLWRGDVAHFSAAAPAEPELWIEEEALFGGYPLNSYGHFLLEGVSRLWLARNYSDLPIVWLAEEQYLSWQQQVLNLLGVRNPPIFVRRPTGFRNLLVPEPGYIMQKAFERGHAEFLTVVPTAPVTPGKKVWLSRSLLQQRMGMVVNQEAIEQRIEKLGWTIYHPEQHPVLEQLTFLADAERIAGVAGSAFHSLILLEEVGASVDLFLRYSMGPANEFSRIAQLKRINQRLHDVNRVTVGPGLFPSWEKIFWPSIESVIQALR